MAKSTISDTLYLVNDAAHDGVEQEKGRLDFQHHVFDDMMRNELLPPHIASEIAANPSPRICDIAAGSAIWLKELAKTLPKTAGLFGLDFDASRFPKPDTLPPNITLGFGNAFEPFPEELRNSFDVVNLRFFLFAVKKDQGVPLIQNLLSLVRPGGWLIWTDCTWLLSSAEPPSQALFRHQQIQYAFGKQENLDMDLPLAMTSYMEQAGLLECDDRYYDSGSILFGPKASDWIPRVQRLIVTGAGQAVKGIFTKGGVDGMSTQEEYDDYIENLRADMSGARRPHVSVIRAWGRKPS
ncbi:hypothetical protein F4777DRAFT_103028 [Nemania sp. FL0916]|nr:hypothetical protein F4777DRAFT_103028 [Nemania sp. FL0916]